MAVTQHIIAAFWQQDFTTLTSQHTITILYCIMFVTLLLENGLLITSFLPGDSLLLLAGALISKGVIDFTPTIVILTIAASLGYWLSYLQGRWLGTTNIVKNWLTKIPHKHYQRAICMFSQHGLLALLTGRFLAFVRTILPTIAGVSGFSNCRFQLFNWLSALLWVGIVTSFGYILDIIPFVKSHEEQFMTLLIIMPLIIFIISLIGVITIIFRKKSYNT